MTRFGVQKSMSIKTFFVNNGQSNLGPFDLLTIAAMVDRLEIKATDFLCVNTEKDEWVMICQYPEFIALVSQSSKPSLKPTLIQTSENQTSAQSASHPSADLRTNLPTSPQAQTKLSLQGNGPSGDLTNGQWYVLKGKDRFGPFTYLDVLRMLQEKSIFEYDFVWAQGLEVWKRIAEVDVFNSDQVRRLAGEKANDGIFFRRHHPRNKYECPIVAHDNNQVWRGKAIELSEGGAGVIIENAMIVPGQNVYLHFKPGAVAKPFNVLCEVVSKRYMKGIRDHETPVVYGIKFINIQKTDREAIRANIAA